MSAQGVFVRNWTEGNNNSMRRPKSKTELKDLVSEGKLDSIYIEDSNNFFGPPKFDGVLSKEALLEQERQEIVFVGPEPETKRDFFGKFFINNNGDVRVE